MNKKSKKSLDGYNYKQLSHTDKFLLCPECFEILFRDDIEHFGRCPYCNAPLEMDSELEDYILKPVVDKWIWKENSMENKFFQERLDQYFSDKYLC